VSEKYNRLKIKMSKIKMSLKANVNRENINKCTWQALLCTLDGVGKSRYIFWMAISECERPILLHFLSLFDHNKPLIWKKILKLSFGRFLHY